MLTITSLPKRFLADEEGATLLEYGMLTLLITVLSIAAIKTIGQKVSTGFTTVSTQLP
ncbi:Flp family type IVb pilin [Gemmatimonas sp.]|jgi:pilus assembly protein Flp/PilA|uniref:Flp family type IVb pilin n=1 Tax=Gemmatimonas sp. TaxID=1962908 RepID=UPI0037BE7108